MSVYVLVIILVNTAIGATALFPFWTPCPQGPEPEWSQCALRAVQKAYPNMIDGNPEYSLPVMDPLHEDKFVIHKGSDLMGVTVEVTNATITGLGNSSVRSFKIDLNEGHVEVGLDIPQLILTGKYLLSGEILTLYANGSGDTHMTLDNIKGILTQDFDKFRSLSRDGVRHEYFNTTSTNMIMDVEDARMVFDNLYHGDKALERQANSLLSRNWRDLFKFLQPAFNRAVSEAFDKLTAITYEFMALDEMYPPVAQPAETTTTLP